LRALRYVILATLVGVLIAGRGATGLARAAELSSSVQQHIRAATFEVVQLKPPDGEVTYDREPPLELIPYQQRIDKYRSIGTAFAIAANRFVTAAHVIGLGIKSQFGPPALRDAAGKVYDIDQVLKFSDPRDFVVFSLRQPPQGLQFLTAGGKPALNASVYAVGNALGEGVIVRDGVYTSDTPEEVNGEWQWLRFSAAASPGNSGGPLVNQQGKVLGIVLRKSPAENLNTALPYAELAEAKEGEGKLGGRWPMRLSMIDASETVRVDERFDLPKSLADLNATLSEAATRIGWGATTRLLERNADHLFPRGAGSERMLHTTERSAFPQLLHEDPNRVWVLGAPTRQTVQLDNNGFVELAGGLLRLRVPDDIRLGTLYGDDKLYLDLLLKAHTLRRTVGSDSVRVTSLGTPKTASRFTDRWGRTWQVRDWAIPYDDQILSLASLRTPEGYVATLNVINTGIIDLIHKGQQLTCDYLYQTLQGSLAQWQAYLAEKDSQPKAFSSLKIQIDPEREVAFHSDRYQLDVKPELIKLSKYSMLFLDFGFSGEGDAATWDVKRVVVSEGPHTNNWVLVARRTQPPSSTGEGFLISWNKLRSGSFPFNGMIESQNGETSVSSASQVPGAGPDATIRYAIEVTAEGAQTQDTMSRKLALLQRSFKILEQDKN
jgi:serine protease Do